MADCLEPVTGNIYNKETGDYIGYRDPVTGNFTPDPAYPLMAIKEDVVCSDSPLITDEVTKQVLYDADTGEPITDGDV